MGAVAVAPCQYGLPRAMLVDGARAALTKKSTQLATSRIQGIGAAGLVLINYNLQKDDGELADRYAAIAKATQEVASNRSDVYARVVEIAVGSETNLACIERPTRVAV